jgi:hypothetical protein
MQKTLFETRLGTLLFSISIAENMKRKTQNILKIK